MSEPQIKSSQLASGVPRQNLLQNGGFEQWHYGLSTTVTNTVGPDKWVLNIASGTASVIRDGVNNDTPGQYCAAITFTGGNGNITQSLVLPTADYLHLRGKTISVSLRGKTAVANGLRVGISVDNGISATVSGYVANDNVYHTVSATVAVPTNSTGVIIYIYGDVAGTYYVDNAMLVVGSAYADYVPSISYPDALPNERIASDLVRLNLLTNGGLENWQRGNGPFTVTGNYNADRWYVAIATGDTFSASADTTHMDGAGTCLALTYTRSSGSTNLQQDLKFSDRYAFVVGKTITFSIRVSGTVANAVRPFIWDNVASYRFGAYHSGGGGYETLTISAPISAAATGNISIGLQFYQSGTFYIDNTTLVPGSAPSDYVSLHPADDLVRCQRYYEIAGQTTNSMYMGDSNGAASSYSYKWLPFKANKPTTVTVTKNGTWATTNSGQPILTSSGSDGFTVQLMAIAAGGFSAGNNASGENFTAEANP